MRVSLGPISEARVGGEAIKVREAVCAALAALGIHGRELSLADVKYYSVTEGAEATTIKVGLRMRRCLVVGLNFLSEAELSLTIRLNWEAAAELSGCGNTVAKKVISDLRAHVERVAEDPYLCNALASIY